MNKDSTCQEERCRLPTLRYQPDAWLIAHGS